MKSRVILHIGFWVAYLILTTFSKFLFPSTSDSGFGPLELFGRLLMMDAVFLPWQMIPFYALFYYIIPSNKGKNYIVITLQILFVFILCIICFRSLISPVAFHFYGDKIDFNVYSFKRMFYTFLELLPGFALASSIKLYRDKMHSDKNQKELKAQKETLEIQLLKSQFNPHFLFNTLNNLYGLSRKNNVNTSEYILKLSGIMRYIIDESKETSVPLDAEIKLIEDYISLEKIRYDDRLIVNFVKDIHVIQQISPLILITFVENAFKHGASENAGKSFIDIKLKTDVNQIDFKINNSTTNREMNVGNGITNAKKQLQLLYPNKHRLDINHNDNVFSVHLILHT